VYRNSISTNFMSGIVNVSIAVVLCCFRKKYQEGCLHKPLISSRLEKPWILWCAFFKVKTAWLCQNLYWRLFKRLCNFSWYSPGIFDTICLCVTFCLLSTKSKLFYKKNTYLWILFYYTCWILNLIYSKYIEYLCIAP